MVIPSRLSVRPSRFQRNTEVVIKELLFFGAISPLAQRSSIAALIRFNRAILR